MRSKLMAATCCVAILGGCVSDQKQGQAIGTVLGGVAGVLIGSQFGSGSGRIVAMVAGAAAGAFIGNQVGALLDERERLAVAKESNAALENASDGQSSVWSNPDTGATAVITPTASRTETRSVVIVRDKTVAAPPPLEIIGETFVANRNANVRQAPGTDAAIMETLPSGSRIQAVGKVAGSDWILVARNNRSIGYVFAPLLAVAPQIAAVPFPESSTAYDTAGASPAAAMDLDAVPITDREQAMRPAVDLDALETDSAIDLDAEGLVVEDVAAVQQCRTVNITVRKDGKQEVDSFESCRAPDGAWEIL